MTDTLLLLHAWSLRFRLQQEPAHALTELVERAVADGFDGIGINFNGPQGDFIDLHDERVLRTTAELLRERGLDCDLETTGTEPRHLAAQLELAATLGARHLHTYSTHHGRRTEMIDATIRDLRAIGPIAERCNVPVLIENHEEFTGVEIARILAAVDHPFVGALFDYGNSMMVREEPLAALEAMLPWVHGAHLKDHVVIGDAVCGVPIGEGALPLAEITRRLAAAGMTRISFENVWSYASPFHPREDGLPEASTTSPIFSPRVDPGDAGFFLADVAGELLRDPNRVVMLEEDAYQRARRHVDRLLRTGAPAPD